MILGYLFLQVIVEKLFKMGMGTAKLTLSAETIVLNNIKIMVNLSLILKKSHVHSLDWHQLPVRNSTPVAYELQFYLRSFTTLTCLPPEQLQTQKENPLN